MNEKHTNIDFKILTLKGTLNGILGCSSGRICEGFLFYMNQNDKTGRTNG